MLFSDINELKIALEVDPEDASEDAALSLYLEWATNWICEFLNRPDFTKKARTEYYKATATTKLPLRYRPVYPTPTPVVTIDTAGYFGAASGAFTGTSIQALTYGTDFTLMVDQPDGTSRCGILLRIRNFWERPSVRKAGLLTPYVDDDQGSLKVVYTGGHTVDTLPPMFRMACVLLVTRLRYLFPLGMALRSENYEERSISLAEERKDYLMGLVKPMLIPYRNWKF